WRGSRREPERADKRAGEREILHPKILSELCHRLAGKRAGFALRSASIALLHASIPHRRSRTGDPAQGGKPAARIRVLKRMPSTKNRGSGAPRSATHSSFALSFARGASPRRVCESTHRFAALR